MRRGHKFNAQRVPEKYVQAAIVKLLRTIGAKVYVLGTKRRKGDHPGTMQTPGICDVLAFLPIQNTLVGRGRMLLAIEAKAKGGRLSEPQAEFRELCEAANVNYLCGGLDDVIAYLKARSYLKSTAGEV